MWQQAEQVAISIGNVVAVVKRGQRSFRFSSLHMHKTWERENVIDCTGYQGSGGRARCFDKPRTRAELFWLGGHNIGT